MKESLHSRHLHDCSYRSRQVRSDCNSCKDVLLFASACGGCECVYECVFRPTFFQKQNLTSRQGGETVHIYSRSTENVPDF